MGLCIRYWLGLSWRIRLIIWGCRICWNVWCRIQMSSFRDRFSTLLINWIQRLLRMKRMILMMRRRMMGETRMSMGMRGDRREKWKRMGSIMILLGLKAFWLGKIGWSHSSNWEMNRRLWLRLWLLPRRWKKLRNNRGCNSLR